MTIDDCINQLIAARKRISIDAMTGHLDRMEDLEIKSAYRNILKKFYEDAFNAGKCILN